VVLGRKACHALREKGNLSIVGNVSDRKSKSPGPYGLEKWGGGDGTTRARRTRKGWVVDRKGGILKKRPRNFCAKRSKD